MKIYRLLRFFQCFCGIGVLIVLIPLVFGCAGLTGKDQGKLYEHINRSEFMDRSTYNLSVPKQTEHIALSLFEAPQILRLDMELPNVDRIMYVKLIQRDVLNINRHMLQGEEYIFNQEEGVLHVLLDMPLVYLCNYSMDFTLDIAGLNKDKSRLENPVRTIHVNWHPVKDKDNEVGFEYVDTKKGIFGLESFQGQVRKELERTNIQRFDRHYANKILDYVQ